MKRSRLLALAVIAVLIAGGGAWAIAQSVRLGQPGDNDFANRPINVIRIDQLGEVGGSGVVQRAVPVDNPHGYVVLVRKDGQIMIVHRDGTVLVPKTKQFAD